MEIEVGKKYRTRSGEVIKIISRASDNCFAFNASNGNSYTSGGSYWSAGNVSQHDLVEEFPAKPTGPVRTVTRKEIVPGRYGAVTVDTNGTCAQIRVEKLDSPKTWFTAAELRATISTLTEIADALEGAE